nr:hypothetical protein [Tanacetum cinerariifolium]
MVILGDPNPKNDSFILLNSLIDLLILLSIIDHRVYTYLWRVFTWFDDEGGVLGFGGGGTGYAKETIHVEYEWEPPHWSKGQTSGADDEDFILVKRKKSCGSNRGTKTLNQFRETCVDDDYNPYDDDMYKGQEISENIQTICDNLDIKFGKSDGGGGELGGGELGGGDEVSYLGVYSMEDEKVPLVNGVFEGALGALDLEIEALVDAMEFWATVSIKKVNNVVKLRAIIDGKRVVVFEDFIRHDLRLDDADGVECLPNEEIFTELARLGYEKPPHVLTFYKAFFSAQWKFLIHTLVQCISTKRMVWNEFSCSMASAVICLATSRKFNFSKYIFDSMGRKDDVSAATKEASPADPTVFDDEEVTMTMAQTLIKIKAKKSRLLDEQMTKRLHYEEVEQATAREKQEKDDLEKAKVLQKQYVDKQENIDWNVVVKRMQEKHLDNIRKYQSLKRKLISIAQARKNMIVYLKNMAGYKMEHFKGMTYDKVRPIFEREYNKVQTLFKPDKDVEEPTKKRVAKETLLRESFKKLKQLKSQVLILHKIPQLMILRKCLKKMLRTYLKSSQYLSLRVGGITEAYQSFEDMLKGFDKEDLDALWRLVKERLSSVVLTVDKEKALWVELKRLFEPDTEDVLWKLQRYMHYPLTWKLHSNCGMHQVSSTMKSHGMFMLTEKNYPLSNRVITLILSAKLQVEEDNDMARDLVMKIFMEANKPKSKSLDTSSKPPVPPPTQQIPHTILSIKLLILKREEYDIWAMKMEHYLSHTDYPIWQVIQNGNGRVSVTTNTNGMIKVLPPKTAEEVVAREKERKAKTTLLMALPAKFHKMADAKEMWEAIKSRFDGNDESKKITAGVDDVQRLEEKAQRD